METFQGGGFSASNRKLSEAFTLAGAAASRSEDAAYWSTKVQLKISEAKNLVGGKDLADAYVYVLVDNEIVARTSTIWRQTNPFWGEDFSLDVATDFQTISLHVYNQEKSGNDEPLGIVYLSRSIMENTQGEGKRTLDGWLPLMKPGQGPTDFYGEVLLEMLLSETDTGLDHLTVTVHKARDLLPKDTTTKCDPMVALQLDAQEVTTEKVKNSRYPNYLETFHFERAKLGPTLMVTVKDSGIRGSTILGEANVKLDGLKPDIPKLQWHRLRPRKVDIERFSQGCGSIRIGASLSNDLILPFQSYEMLISLLKSSVQTEQKLQTGILYILEEVIAERASYDRETVARTLVRVLLRENACVAFLKSLNGLEIRRAVQSSTLFRGNSLATKCTDQFMKSTGLRYLHGVLKKDIDLIFHETKDCEIDPSKIGKKADITKNTANLIPYLQKIFSHIFASVDSCPKPMRVAFKHLQEGARNNSNFTSDDTAYTVVSGFLFLRFFAPAVLAPKLFGMREELADARTSRTLTLLAKALQAVGNLGSSIGSGKEQYMAPLFPVIKANLVKVRQFIDDLCNIDEDAVDEFNESIAPSHTVFVRGEVLCRVPSLGKSFKKRTCTVSDVSLRIHKVLDATQDLLDIPLYKIHTVEQMEASVFDKKHVILVQALNEDPVYLYLESTFEMSLWLQGFRRAGKHRTKGRPPVVATSFCPGQNVKGRWSCCKNLVETSKIEGCSKTHSTVSIDQFLDNPPPEVWAHKLFSILMEGHSKMEATIAIGPNPEKENSDLEKQKLESMQQFLNVLNDIYLAHLLHQDGELF
eukprot:m.138291 g.138291  ORF g.138291 m.138291 type:complete len:811 (+) comp14773_c0_seq1:287-2719(+)